MIIEIPGGRSGKPTEIQIIIQRNDNGTFIEKPITVRLSNGDLRYFGNIEVTGPSVLAMTPERKRIVLFTRSIVKEIGPGNVGETLIRVRIQEKDRHDRMIKPCYVTLPGSEVERFDEVTIYGPCQMQITKDRKHVFIDTMADVKGRNIH